MFTPKEHILLTSSYFKLIRKTDDFYEIQSKCTKHCWIIQKPYSFHRHPVRIYHKHNKKIPYYHKHGYSYTIHSAIRQIKDHDAYVLQSNQLTLV